MEVKIRAYTSSDCPQATALWNQIVEQGDSFPGDRPLGLQEADQFFLAQTFTGCACQGERLLGLYVLHPNNIGRCAHIANASYAVDGGTRGLGIGRQLVLHSLGQAGNCGFTGLQFNAVVCTNQAAIHLYEQLGFTRVGAIPGGYRLKQGGAVDIYIYYHDTPADNGAFAPALRSGENR